MSGGLSNMGGEGGEAQRLLQASARRHAAAVGQLRIADSLRLTEWQLSTIRRLLSGLVRTVEDELRTGLAARFTAERALQASLSSAELAIAAPVVERSVLAADPELLAHLLRRLEEHRLQRGANEGAGEGLLAALIRDADEGIASDAMAVLIARSRRLDRFQEPLMASTELPAELQHRLVWSVAAALRLYLVQHHGIAPGIADEALAAEASAHLAAYDEGEALEARCMRLAQRLAGANRLDDAFAERAATGGQLSLFTAALAVRTGLAFTAAWELLSDPDARGAPLLLSAAGVRRQPAAAILLALSGEADIAEQLDLFDATRPGEARQSLLLWRIDPAYRAALSSLIEQAA